MWWPMPDLPSISLRVGGKTVQVAAGSTVIAAMLSANVPCRVSVSGEQRTALCGMGICFDCRAVVDGVPHQRTCQLLCREGMEVETQI